MRVALLRLSLNPSPMISLRALLLAAGLLSFSGPELLRAQSAPPAPVPPADPATVAVLRETIAQWIETERLISEETQGWVGRKAAMNELLEVYHQELVLLDEELAKAGQSAASFDTERTALQSRIAAQKAARTDTARAIATAREQLLELGRLFPPPLLETVSPDLEILKGWKGSEEDVRAALQALLRILEQAQRFASHISHAREIRDGRELEVVYLGVACAYYTGGAGIAGMGRPGKGGWQWEDRPDLALRIRLIVEQLAGDAPPRLLTLPVPARSAASQP